MSEPNDSGAGGAADGAPGTPAETPKPAAPPSRRDFLNVAISGTAATLGVLSAYPVVRFLAPSSEAQLRTGDAGDEETFPRGSGRTILLGSRPALVIRLDDGSFRAFSALCTHLQCIVVYSAERRRIECPCHRGIFSLDGLNVAGPPPSPLKPLSVEVINGKVTVSEV
jgi:Rieske Fe-S protein